MKRKKLLVPIKMQPVFKDYLWGGSELNKSWNKNSPFERTAESWELSAQENGTSFAAEGEYKGKSLTEIIDILGPGAVGKDFGTSDRFPLLVKLIDPAKDLSVQVHPDDAYAMEHENDFGKTEMWYVADRKPGSRLLCGFNRDMDRETFRRASKDGSLTDYLNQIEVEPGDAFLIEAGTVHAIGKDMLIVEIQQNSNVTYRIYDYGRRGPDGKTRELHLDRALQVTDFKKFSVNTDDAQRKYEEKEYGTYRHLAESAYFRVGEYILDKENPSLALSADERSFHTLVFLDGRGTIEHKGSSYDFIKGDTFFIPAGSGDYCIKGRSLFLQASL